MIKNLIFDIGNVLADYNWRGFLEAQGFEPEMVEHTTVLALDVAAMTGKRRTSF